MKIPLYQIDAFTRGVFSGNPAAVCPLEKWLPDSILQNIAAENNLSETAFFIPQGEDYQLRWFTPTTEVDLCGHATLASGFVLFNKLNYIRERVRFDSRSGPLAVAREGNRLALDFPAWDVKPCPAPPELVKAFGRKPKEVLKGNYYLAVFDSEEEVKKLNPDMAELLKLGKTGIIASAPGKDVNFVSRFFVPAYGIPEDPVTGSSHCILTPYWSKRLGKTKLSARQVSARGGELFCEDKGERVKIAGEAVLYLEGEITI